MRKSFVSFSICVLLLCGLQVSAALNPVFYALNTATIAAPPDVTGLAALEDTTTTMMLFWTSGGGTTSSYRISYQSGATAPASCTTGTQVSEATVGSATNYIVTGLTASTKYSFRVCASNAVSTYSTGVTVTITTPASQPIFRSVGYNQTTAKETGGGSNRMTISGSVATFVSSLGNTIGVGDAIQYSTANNATMDRVVFIHGRLSSTQFLVKTAGGATPTAVSANTTWSLFRSYTSINNALAGTENSGISAAVQNFDSWSGGANLTTLGATWYIECYADAAHTSTYANIGSGWTTSTNNKLYVTTPWETRHVGTRQRHIGTWSSSYFNASLTNNNVLEVDISNVVIEGLQLQVTESSSAGDNGGPINVGAGVTFPASGVVEINSNILEIVNTSGAFRDDAGIYVTNPNTSMALYATNNVILCTGSLGSSECAQGIRGTWTSNDAASWTAYVYNNTVVGAFQYGIDFYNSGTGTKTAYLKNNIVQGVRYTSYEGTNHTGFAGGSDYNISADTTTTGGAHDKASATVSFVAPASKNYHLSSSDTTAKDAGTNLSTDPFYPITMDIDMTTRTGTWDIGADEY